MVLQTQLIFIGHTSQDNNNKCDASPWTTIACCGWTFSYERFLSDVYSKKSSLHLASLNLSRFSSTVYLSWPGVKNTEKYYYSTPIQLCLHRLDRCKQKNSGLISYSFLICSSLIAFQFFNPKRLLKMFETPHSNTFENKAVSTSEIPFSILEPWLTRFNIDIGRNPEFTRFSWFFANFGRFSVSEMSDFMRVNGLLFIAATFSISATSGPLVLGHGAEISGSTFSLSRSRS